MVASIWEAAGRALRLANRQPPAHQEDAILDELKQFQVTQAGLEPRTPFATTLELVYQLLVSEPERVWTNQDVLRDLLREGYATDRADVNIALSDLASMGRARRISRGHYVAVRAGGSE